MMCCLKLYIYVRKLINDFKNSRLQEPFFKEQMMMMMICSLCIGIKDEAVCFFYPSCTAALTGVVYSGKAAGCMTLA